MFRQQGGFQFHGDPQSIRKVESWSDGGNKFIKEYGNTYEMVDGEKDKNEITIRCLEKGGKVIRVMKQKDGDIMVDGEFFCKDWDHNAEAKLRKIKESKKKSDVVDGEIT